MKEMLPINIVIGDRTYRIKIKPEDEEPVRKVVKLINDKIVDFKIQFAGKDMQDYIAMVLVWYATLQVNQQVTLFQAEELAGKLRSVEDLLDKFLK